MPAAEAVESGNKSNTAIVNKFFIRMQLFWQKTKTDSKRLTCTQHQNPLKSPGFKSKIMAHKKAGGSTQNIRDSQPKYLGVKKFGGETVIAGNIIIRQKGLKYKPGRNVYAARDFTLHAKTDGVVKFSEKRAVRFDRQAHTRTVVNVEPIVAK
jgi:large subunit ribosomal protein L27